MRPLYSLLTPLLVGTLVSFAAIEAKADLLSDIKGRGEIVGIIRPLIPLEMDPREQAGALPQDGRDRMGSRGLRPVSLPHHRTCGFPHPAVELEDGLRRRRFPRQGKPITFQRFVLQRSVHHPMPGYRPRSFRTACHAEDFPVQAQPLQGVQSPSRVVPS